MCLIEKLDCYLNLAFTFQKFHIFNGFFFCLDLKKKLGLGVPLL